MVLLVAVFTLIGLGPGAAAGPGVGISPGRIKLEAPILAGNAQQLPLIEVVNPGDVTVTYRMAVRPVPGSARPPGTTVIAFDPQSFVLAPGGHQSVATKITVDPKAKAGTYHAYLAAEVRGTGHGGRLGAAAASRFSFTVSRSGGRPGRPAAATYGTFAVLALSAIIVSGLVSYPGRLREPLSG